jgi:hypothetical protein
MKYTAHPVVHLDDSNDIYLAVIAVQKYFTDNPDEPYVELIAETDDVREVVGRINNPKFTELIYAVSYGLDRLKRKNAIRTVQINNK